MAFTSIEHTHQYQSPREQGRECASQLRDKKHASVKAIKREGGGLIMDAATVTLFTHYPHLIALTARCCALTIN